MNVLQRLLTRLCVSEADCPKLPTSLRMHLLVTLRSCIRSRFVSECIYTSCVLVSINSWLQNIKGIVCPKIKILS